MRNDIYSREEQIQVLKLSETVSTKIGDKEVDVSLASAFDFSGFEYDQIKEWYQLMHLGRRLDDKAALYLKMAKGWSYHASFAGHDGIQLALGKIFRQRKDYLFPYYRDMMTSLAVGITPEEIILNGLSKETDVAGGGRHMSNHFAKPEINIQNVSSCTGNHSQHSAGLARAIKKYNSDEIVYYSSGESATNEGYFFEAVNAANAEKLPVVFVIQNNKYAISVPLKDVSPTQDLSEYYIGFRNLKIIKCDGRDPFDSYRALQKAKKYVESGRGPAMVHADCDRIRSHSNSDRHEGYRSEKERKNVELRDPLMQFRYHIETKGIIDRDELAAIEQKNIDLVFEAADKAEAAPDADGSKYYEYVLPDAFYSGEEKNVEKTEEKQTFLEAINSTLKEEFRSNPDTYLWGQDIGKGGVFNVVKGMPEEFGKERVFNAQIAENQIVGTANGFSRFNDKIRVVIEGAEFADYFWPAMDQLIELSHEYWRTKGQNSPNVTIRLASGGYIQGGLYHSQTLESVLATIPGIRVVMPSSAEDAAGLLRNSIRSEGTTMFLEPKFLYNFKPATGNKTPEDYVIPFGKAKVVREGSDVTIVTYGSAVHLSGFAADELEKEGISVEIIDLRSILPWDKETVLDSVKKTNRVVVAHEDKLMGSFGNEIASVIGEEGFDYLDAPVQRVGSKNTPVGFAKSYEQNILLSKEDIIEAVRKVKNY